MTNTLIKRSYSKLILLKTFEDRFRYLKLQGLVGERTLGSHRYLTQEFYRNKTWKDFRHHIIIRDNGCDLGIRDRIIYDDEVIHIHHINPITVEEALDNFDLLMDENNVITTSDKTHRAIHYGNEACLSEQIYIERSMFDTCPWKKGGVNNVMFVHNSNNY